MPRVPPPKTARAISDSIDGYPAAYGVAWVTWASQMTPNSKNPSRHAIMVSALRALGPCGWRKTLTASAIASTPVNDVPPLANERSSTKMVAPMTKPLPW